MSSSWTLKGHEPAGYLAWLYSGRTEVVKDLKVVATSDWRQTADHGSNTWPAFILGGVIYSVNENLDLDFGVKGGLNRPEPDVTALAGLAWRF